jgi:hypothetical protein
VSLRDAIQRLRLLGCTPSCELTVQPAAGTRAAHLADRRWGGPTHDGLKRRRSRLNLFSYVSCRCGSNLSRCKVV